MAMKGILGIAAVAGVCFFAAEQITGQVRGIPRLPGPPPGPPSNPGGGVPDTKPTLPWGGSAPRVEVDRSAEPAPQPSGSRDTAAAAAELERAQAAHDEQATAAARQLREFGRQSQTTFAILNKLERAAAR